MNFFKSWYAIWVLFLFTCAYALNNLNRYIFGSIAKTLESAVGFGDGTGSSLEYSLLIGPAFTIPQCAALAPTGWIADKYNKVWLMVVLIVWWSICTGLMVLCTDYWQLILLRSLSAIGSAGAAAVGSGVLSEYFPQTIRGTAMGIYAWGVPFGIGAGFGLGNYVTHFIGYKMALLIAAAPGILVALAMFLTVEHQGPNSKYIQTKPKMLHQVVAESQDSQDGEKKVYDGTEAFNYLRKRRAIVALYIAGCFRQIASLNWIYYETQFFEINHGLEKDVIAEWLSWIPVVGGIFGGLCFGYLSDRLVAKGHGPFGRLSLLSITHFLEIGCITGVLLLPVPYTFLMLLAVEFLKGYWVPGAMASIIHLVPKEMKVQAVAFFWLANNFVGGMLTTGTPLLIKLFSDGDEVDENGRLSEKTPILLALVCLWLGAITMAALFFFLAAVFQYWEQKMERIDLEGSQLPVGRSEDGEVSGATYESLLEKDKPMPIGVDNLQGEETRTALLSNLRTK